MAIKGKALEFLVSEDIIFRLARKILQVPFDVSNSTFIPVPLEESGFVTYTATSTHVRIEQRFKYFHRTDIRQIAWATSSGEEMITAINMGEGQWLISYVSLLHVTRTPYYSLLGEFVSELPPPAPLTA